jgi:hypothetical protein
MDKFSISPVKLVLRQTSLSCRPPGLYGARQGCRVPSNLTEPRIGRNRLRQPYRASDKSTPPPISLTELVHQEAGRLSLLLEEDERERDDVWIRRLIAGDSGMSGVSASPDFGRRSTSPVPGSEHIWRCGRTPCGAPVRDSDTATPVAGPLGASSTLGLLSARHQSIEDATIQQTSRLGEMPGR